MSYVIAAPEMMTAAATDLASIGSTLSAAHMTAALPTAAVIPGAADEVSASIAHLFSQYGGGFQALAGKASVFHDQFVHTVKASASAYTGTEAANASSLLQTLGQDFNTWAESLPPQVQNTLADLEGFVLGPLFLGILIGAILFAVLVVAIEKLLGQFGL
jgi:PE family